MTVTLTKRGYLVDGEIFPRVSQILNVINRPFLATWRGKVGNQEADRIAREATTFGTKVHSACAAVCGGPPCDDDPDLFPFVDAFVEWMHEHTRRVVEVERLVVSRKWHYAGTCDLLAVMADGALAVCDLKTSKSLSPEYALQLAAYRAALREEGLDVTRRLVLWLPRLEPGVVRVSEYGDHQGDEYAWLHCLAVWKWTQASDPNQH